MKKIVMILFSVSLLLFAAGCSDNDSSNPSTQGSSTEQGGGTDQGSGKDKGNTEQNNTNESNTNESNTNESSTEQNNTGQGGETLTPEQKAINSIIGEYAVNYVKLEDEANSQVQPEGDKSFIRINSENYNNLLIYSYISIDSGQRSAWKYLIYDYTKFINEKLKKQADGSYIIILPTAVGNIEVKITKTKSYEINNGIGVQNTPITINVNNGSTIAAQEKSLPVEITHKNIKTPALTVYEASVDLENYIYYTDIDSIYISNIFNVGQPAVTGDKALYTVQVTKSFTEEPFRLFLFDAETQDKSNTFGLLKVELPQR